MPLLTLLGQAVATFAASFGVGVLPLMFKSVSGKSNSREEGLELEC